MGTFLYFPIQSFKAKMTNSLFLLGVSEKEYPSHFIIGCQRVVHTDRFKQRQYIITLNFHLIQIGYQRSSNVRHISHEPLMDAGIHYSHVIYTIPLVIT